MTKEMNSSVAEAKKGEFSITRVFNAPRDLVFKAFSEGDRLLKWWGPKGFNMVVGKLDFRPNGIFHYCMKTPDGHEMWGKFVYREIIAPEKIVFVNSFSDAQGNITRHPMSQNWPAEILNVLTLTENEGKTTLTLRGNPINATEDEQKVFEDGFSSMNQGFKGTLDQLDQYLAGVV